MNSQIPKSREQELSELFALKNLNIPRTIEINGNNHIDSSGFNAAIRPQFMTNSEREIYPTLNYYKTAENKGKEILDLLNRV
jgi:hypothetical protein